MVLAEDVGGEPDDGAGDALGSVRARLFPGAQGAEEDASEGIEGEGVRARRVDVRVGQGGDVHQERGHPRFGSGEGGGGFEVAGLHLQQLRATALRQALDAHYWQLRLFGLAELQVGIRSVSLHG
ncbi:hypothetical protein [Streptomyces uncialis]|uniref:Uncharacterized protein n=1 Tax=Streptomyces uncialis TaxID=1048205 RepID=A0A1Q4V3E5_9ACTN|nr:hypothetical protein [Streptomyces uncialis]OKH92356.1 hypothetical protein AB852_25980 [Streptomyces uncialis]